MLLQGDRRAGLGSPRQPREEGRSTGRGWGGLCQRDGTGAKLALGLGSGRGGLTCSVTTAAVDLGQTTERDPGFLISKERQGWTDHRWLKAP